MRTSFRRKADKGRDSIGVAVADDGVGDVAVGLDGGTLFHGGDEQHLQLQVLLISTVEKSTAIQPYCDITYSIVRHGDANAIAPFVRLAAE